MNNKYRQRILITAAAVVLGVAIAVILASGFENKNTYKVGLILTGAASDEGWNGQHYKGVSGACEEFGAKLLVMENVSEGSGECAEAIRKLADSKVNMIILSSYSYPSEVADVISEYPEIAFYGISSEYSSANMSSYFGRMYQARYLAGIVAGMQTESNKIGYVAAMPNNEVNRGINAFTLGVKSVNPSAEVYVRWTDSWDDSDKETAAAELLIEKTGADVLTYHQNQHNTAIAADKAGIYSIGYNQTAEGLSEKYLTAAVWDWKSLYCEIVGEVVQGQPNQVRQHWFGITKGVVGLSDYSPLVSDETRNAVEAARSRFDSGLYIFSGEIFDNNGEQRCGDGEILSDDVLLKNMDWYVDGVIIYE